MPLSKIFGFTLALFPSILAVAGCGSGAGSDHTTPVPQFPVGTYSTCASGEAGQDSKWFANASGFEPGATLTVSQSGSTVTAKYLDFNHVTTTFDFEVTAPTSARLATGGVTFTNLAGMCVQGPGDFTSHPATLTANVGTLFYASGTALLSVTGTEAGNLGSCGEQSEPKALWVVCGDGPTAPPSDATASTGASFPVGTYACVSDMEAYQGGEIVGTGAQGKLTLTQTGSVVTAKYSGDTSLEGTLNLDVASDTSATAAAGQSMATPCTVPLAAGQNQTAEPMPVTAASLLVDGSTLLLSFAGTMGAGTSCAGAREAGTLYCSKQ
jgi:hypothetical protein